MKTLLQFPHIALPALALMLLPAQGPDTRDVDPPSRVARLGFISGSVSFRPGDVDDWTDATVNSPLRSGDHLWTDGDARTEISLGSNVIRLDQFTDFGFLALDDRTAQIDLSEGTLDVRLRRLDDRDVFEIDTPNGAVSLQRPGTYRVDVDSSGDTTVVTVRGGAVEVTASGASFSVEAGQVGILAGRDAPSYDIESAGQPDDWERWCASRDRRWDESRSTRYVSPKMVGYEDLDDHGDWRDGGSYGPVWVPRDVASGWAPYRYGHWAWVDPWGWTWVDAAAWGFAPFHYGRWVYYEDRWDGGRTAGRGADSSAARAGALLHEGAGAAHATGPSARSVGPGPAAREHGDTRAQRPGETGGAGERHGARAAPGARRIAGTTPAAAHWCPRAESTTSGGECARR